MVEYFSSNETDWWVYDNPLSPAKASGGMFYRSLSWGAWSVNAVGIGFWSFSDTGRSSAWDDFDGRRPDYSVIYDYDGTLIKSLRWESFCDGVEDFKLLSVTKFGSKQKIEILTKIRNGEFNYSDIVIYRKRALLIHSTNKAKSLQ